MRRAVDIPDQDPGGIPAAGAHRSQQDGDRRLVDNLVAGDHRARWASALAVPVAGEGHRVLQGREQAWSLVAWAGPGLVRASGLGRAGRRARLAGRRRWVRLAAEQSRREWAEEGSSPLL